MSAPIPAWTGFYCFSGHITWRMVFIYHEQLKASDADPGLRDLCVVAAMEKYTWTTEILWRKRDGMATLWVREGKRAREPNPCLNSLFIAFLGTLHQGWSSFTTHRFVVGGSLLQTTKERMLLNPSKKDFAM